MQDAGPIILGGVRGSGVDYLKGSLNTGLNQGFSKYNNIRYGYELNTTKLPLPLTPPNIIEPASCNRGGQEILWSKETLSSHGLMRVPHSVPSAVKVI